MTKKRNLKIGHEQQRVIDAVAAGHEVLVRGRTCVWTGPDTMPLAHHGQDDPCE